VSPSVRLVDTTMRDGSHSVAHQYTPEQVATVAKMLDDAGVWAVAVGHGDGLGSASRQYGYAAYPDAELLAAAAEVIERAEIAVALLPGIGTKDDLRAAQDAGATVVRVSTVITEADIGIQHLKLAGELGMTPHSHLNMASIGTVEQTVEAAKIVLDAGSQCAYLVDTCGAFLQDDVRARVSALREALGDQIAIGIHEHNNLSLAVSNSVAAIEEGATIADVTLAGMGAGAGNCQGEALVAVLHRMGIETGTDLFALQDAADSYVRKELMPGPIVVDRLTASMGYANVPASLLVPVIRAGQRFGVDPRAIILELGERQVVTGQDDLILDVASRLARAA
jgi:4-hydroxy 2-oxovalerate aldolase